jgi:S-disulfanyl-L-cysteine oxidoreductase SoxD
MRCSPRILAQCAVVLHIACITALAQAPDYSNIGRTPSPAQIKAEDIAVGVEGKELPPGSGSAKEGAQIFARKCSPCHGADLKGGYVPGQAPGAPKVALVGGKETIGSANPVRTVGSYWPFATTVWDYVNRAMPRFSEGTLKPDEVYAVVAFILYKNDIIKETDVLDAKSLPKVQMPNRNNFLPARFEEIPDLKKRGCKVGQCPDGIR